MPERFIVGIGQALSDQFDDIWIIEYTALRHRFKIKNLRRIANSGFAHYHEEKISLKIIEKDKSGFVEVKCIN